MEVHEQLNHRHADFQSATSSSWALLINELPGRPMPLIAVLCITVQDCFTQNSRAAQTHDMGNKLQKTPDTPLSTPLTQMSLRLSRGNSVEKIGGLQTIRR